MNAKYSNASHSKPRSCERAEHERGVADPRVAVVPVAFTTRRLRQRRGARGHDRPRGRVAQSLQRERAALEVRPPPVVGDLRQREPVAPVLLGGGALRQRLVVAGRGLALPRQRQPRRLALFERRAAVRARPEDAEAHAAGEVEREVAAPTGDALVAAVVVGPLAARACRSRTAGRSWPAPRPVRSQHVAMRRSVPCAMVSPGTRRYRARRSSVGAGPITSRSHTMSQPVGVCHVVSSTLVPGT